jgi:class 3 adenylate cyclase/tetratricopeptide (TPR) repeat protein
MGLRDDGLDRPPPQHVRRTVTIVFADLAGSTSLGESLDPEALRDVQARYFAAMRRPLERHGGTVEKYIGDAVMAVFGVPALHEDDALRAVRAAVEMRDGLARLNRELERDLGVGLAVRIGVNTGEVAADESAAGHGFVAGDAVNTAARLQAAAPPGCVVVGPVTRRLVAAVARLRPHGPIELRGKRRPVRTWIVDEVPAAVAGVRRPPVDLVGRVRELRRLDGLLGRAAAQERGVLATITGPPGIGKSRLVREFSERASASATVVAGRCLPYGEGITYWPLVEIVEQLAGGRGHADVARVMRDDPDAALVAARVAAAVGGDAAAGGGHDVPWAMRRLLEAAARPRPLVVVVDDVHWAEPALLDLILDVVGRAAAPILAVCPAREELLDRRPDWAAAGRRGGVIRLQPLSRTDSARLVGALASRRRARVRRAEVMAAAEGNPLFLEQLVAMRADDPAGMTPPTIQALLAARVDGLPSAERRILEAASVEGRGFHRGAVTRLLAGEDVAIAAGLDALVRRDLVRPDVPEFPGEAGYRFTHILVRDAAYDLIAKRRRADLHVAYAEWLGEAAAGRSEVDEFAGYHLEQAHGYRTALGRPDDERHRALAEDAAGHLAAAGRRVLVSGERSGAANLLRRAAALRAPDDPERTALLIDLGGVLREEGRFAEAEDVLAEALRRAAVAGDVALDARAQAERLLARLQVDPDGVARLESRQGAGIERALQAARDHAGLARLWHVRALLAWIRARSAEAELAWRTAADEALLAGDRRMLNDAVGWEASSVAMGPTPVDAGIRRCEEIVAILEGDPWARALATEPLAALRAMRGEFGAAFGLLDTSRLALAAFGDTVDAAVSYPQTYVSLLAGELERAEMHLRAGRRLLRRMGERAVLASTEGYLAQVLVAGGRDAQAERCARRCAGLATADDLSPQVLWRQVLARVLARRGRLSRAAVLAREAVEIAATTDHLNLHGEALADLATVLDAGGDATGAEAAREASSECFAEKGNLVRGREVRAHGVRPVSVLRQ